ncbi:MAG TPA: hypothetical protein VFH74_17370 [Gaiellales bacterium]|nr:hypothetical protein [Gaiellales bacterium]
MIATLVMGLCVAPAAYASPLTMLYAPLHVHGTTQSESFIQQHFPTVSVSAGQLKKGWHSSNTGLYTKGTRSNVGTYPESWYMHTAGGARIHDKALKSYFVMNPASSGWRQQVAKSCAGAPQWCFVDAMGADGYTRMSAKPTVSQSWWIQQTIAEANYLENASSRWSVMANNAITANNPSFAVGFEMFGRISAQKSLQVLQHTRCYCFAKFSTESGALYGFTLFLTGAGPGDHISVGSDSQTGKWWDFFTSAGKLGNPTGAATTSGSLITRHYTYGEVVVNTGSSSVTATRSVSLAPHTGKIILG